MAPDDPDSSNGTPNGFRTARHDGLTLKCETCLQEVDRFWRACEKVNMSHEGRELIKGALRHTANAHQSQWRDSGHHYLIHPVAVARQIVEWYSPPANVVAAALLHDCAEDSNLTIGDIEVSFGIDVAFHVDACTKVRYEDEVRLLPINLDQATVYDKTAFNEATIVKFFVFAMEDERVIPNKLSDRWHNSHTLRHVDKAKQKRKAEETMFIYVPLARLLGMNKLADELEDICFEILEPENYREAENLWAQRRCEASQSNHRYARLDLVEMLETKGLNAIVRWRGPSLYKVHRATRHFERRSDKIDAICNLTHIEVVADTKDECDLVYSAIIDSWSCDDVDTLSDARCNLAHGYQRVRATLVYDDLRIPIVIRTSQQSAITEGGLPVLWWSGNGREAGSSQVSLAAELRGIFDANLGRHEAVEEIRELLVSPRILIYEDGLPRLVREGLNLHDYSLISNSEVGFGAVEADVNGVRVDMRVDTRRLQEGQRVQLFGAVGVGPSQRMMESPDNFFDNPVNRILVQQDSATRESLGDQKTDAVEGAIEEPIFTAVLDTTDETASDAIDERSAPVDSQVACTSSRSGENLVKVVPDCGPSVASTKSDARRAVPAGSEARAARAFKQRLRRPKARHVEAALNAVDAKVVPVEFGAPEWLVERRLANLGTAQEEVVREHLLVQGMPNSSLQFICCCGVPERGDDILAFDRGWCVAIHQRYCGNHPEGVPRVATQWLAEPRPAEGPLPPVAPDVKGATETRNAEPKINHDSAVSDRIRRIERLDLVELVRLGGGKWRIEFAKCCDNPEPGDRILGYRSYRKPGSIPRVAVHRWTCEKVQTMMRTKSNHVFEIEWRSRPAAQAKPVSSETEAIFEIRTDSYTPRAAAFLRFLEQLGVDLIETVTEEIRQKRDAIIRFKVRVKDAQLLTRLMDELKRIFGPNSVRQIAIPLLSAA